MDDAVTTYHRVPPQVLVLSERLHGTFPVGIPGNPAQHNSYSGRDPDLAKTSHGLENYRSLELINHFPGSISFLHVVVGGRKDATVTENYGKEWNGLVSYGGGDLRWLLGWMAK